MTSGGTRVHRVIVTSSPSPWSSSFSESQPHFSEPKVVELWALAQGANFTDDELDSIKEELQHFEMRIGKHRFFRWSSSLASLSFARLDIKHHLFRVNRPFFGETGDFFDIIGDFGCTYVGAWSHNINTCERQGGGHTSRNRQTNITVLPFTEKLRHFVGCCHVTFLLNAFRNIISTWMDVNRLKLYECNSLFHHSFVLGS